MNQLAAQHHREMLVGNEYCAPPEEPETPEQVREQFARDNPDFSGEEILDAAKAVDETHKRQYVERGYASNEWEVYKQAGKSAERERYLRERNQEE